MMVPKTEHWWATINKKDNSKLSTRYNKLPHLYLHEDFSFSDSSSSLYFPSFSILPLTSLRLCTAIRSVINQSIIHFLPYLDLCFSVIEYHSQPSPRIFKTSHHVVLRRRCIGIRYPMVNIEFQTNKTNNGSSSHRLFHFIQFFDIPNWIEDDANIWGNCEAW